MIRQHEALRVPQGWTEQDKALIIQLSRIFDDIYKRFGRIEISDLGQALRDQLATYDEGLEDIADIEEEIGDTPMGTTATTITGAIAELGTDISTVEGEIPDVINNLTSDSTTDALSAAQGKALDGSLANKVTGPSSATDNAVAMFDGTTGKKVKNSSKTITDNTSSTAVSNDANIPTNRTVLNAIYNGLDQTVAGFALDARQGKTLNDGLSDLSAFSGKSVTDKTSSTAMSNNTNIPTNRTVRNAFYNGLDKTAAGFALDARQGKALNDSITDITVSRRTAGTYTSGELPAYGWITSSGKDAHIVVPMIWNNNISTVTITKITAAIRVHGGGYLGGSSGVNLTSYLTNSGSTWVYKAGGSMRFVLSNSSGWGFTNNTPFCGLVTLDYTVA